MIISELNYLEVVSEPSSIFGSDCQTEQLPLGDLAQRLNVFGLNLTLPPGLVNQPGILTSCSLQNGNTMNGNMIQTYTYTA